MIYVHNRVFYRVFRVLSGTLQVSARLELAWTLWRILEQLPEKKKSLPISDPCVDRHILNRSTQGRDIVISRVLMKIWKLQLGPEVSHNYKVAKIVF